MLNDSVSLVLNVIDSAGVGVGLGEGGKAGGSHEVIKSQPKNQKAIYQYCIPQNMEPTTFCNSWG